MFMMQLNHWILDIYQGDTAWNKENMVPGDSDTYQGQESILPGMKATISLKNECNFVNDS
jgi:hypothetical protein